MNYPFELGGCEEMPDFGGVSELGHCWFCFVGGIKIKEFLKAGFWYIFRNNNNKKNKSFSKTIM